MKKLSIYLLIALVTVASTNRNKLNPLTGTYKSSAPTLGDTMSIMYCRGNFKFLYITPGDEILELKSDSTFIYSRMIRNNKAIKGIGTWNIIGKNLKLNYKDSTQSDLNFRIKKQQLYNIREGTLCETGKKMKLLTPLKKVE